MPAMTQAEWLPLGFSAQRTRDTFEQSKRCSCDRSHAKPLIVAQGVAMLPPSWQTCAPWGSMCHANARPALTATGTK